MQDHPHAYGDKKGVEPSENFAPGSSPRVWGQDLVSSSGKDLSRIIPTRMGTSIPEEIIFVTGGDHPHAYGDKFEFRHIYNVT